MVALGAELPISFKFDRDRGTTIVTFTGSVTYDDITAHWDEIYSDAKVLDGGRILIDMRKATTEISKAEFVKLATEDWPAERTGHLEMAVVVANPEQFDTARQFQLLAREGSPHQIFFDRADAIMWLKRHH